MNTTIANASSEVIHLRLVIEIAVDLLQLVQLSIAGKGQRACAALIWQLHEDKPMRALDFIDM